MMVTLPDNPAVSNRAGNNPTRFNTAPGGLDEAKYANHADRPTSASTKPHIASLTTGPGDASLVAAAAQPTEKGVGLRRLHRQLYGHSIREAGPLKMRPLLFFYW